MDLFGSTADCLVFIFSIDEEANNGTARYAPAVNFIIFINF